MMFDDFFKSGNRLQLQTREYLIYGGIGMGLILLVILYALEFRFFHRTFEVQWLLGLSAGVGLLLGIFLGHRFSKTVSDLAERIQVYTFCIVLSTVFMPLLGSLSNRLLSPYRAETRTFEFVKEEAYFADRFGMIKGELPKPSGYYLFFYHEGHLERLSTKKPLGEGLQKGDFLSLTIKKGLWGFEWVKI